MKRNVWYIPGHSGSIPAPYGTVYRYFSVFLNRTCIQHSYVKFSTAQQHQIKTLTQKLAYQLNHMNQTGEVDINL